MILPIAAAWLAAPSLLSSAPVDPTPLNEGGLRPWILPDDYPPASPEMVNGLKNLFRSPIVESLLVQAPSLRVFLQLSASSQAHRQLVGILPLSRYFEIQLQTALSISDRDSLTYAFNTVRRAYEGGDAEKIFAAAAEDRAREIADAFSRERMTRDELSNAARELSPFASISRKAMDVQALAQAARADKTIGAELRRTAAGLADFGGPGTQARETVAWGTWVEDSETPETAFARILLGKLSLLEGGREAEGVVGRLQKLAEKNNDPALQRPIVGGLGAEMRRRNDWSVLESLRADRLVLRLQWDHDCNLRVLAALKRIARRSPFEIVQADAVREIMRNVHAGENIDFSNRALDAVARIAAVSGNQVKEIAAALMAGEVRRGLRGHVNGVTEGINDDYRRGILKRIAAVKKSESRAEIKVPSLAAVKARVDYLEPLADLRDQLALAARRRLSAAIQKNPARFWISAAVFLSVVAVLLSPHAPR